MSAAPSFSASAFPFFHLLPFPQSLPSQLDSLKTEEIAVSWLLLDLDSATWRKLLRLWRARREKARGSTDGDQVSPVFELLDMNFDLAQDTNFGFLDSAQLAVRSPCLATLTGVTLKSSGQSSASLQALPLHPGYAPTMAERARTVFLSRRHQMGSKQAAADERTSPRNSASDAPLRDARTNPIVAEPTGTSSHQGSPQTGSASGSTAPSSPALNTPEVSEPHKTSEATLALTKWMTIEKLDGKPNRALASDAFDWPPEPPQLVPTPIFHSLERRSVSPFEESPTPTPEPESQDEVSAEQRTTTFFDGLQFGLMDQAPLEGGDLDIKPDVGLLNRIDAVPPPSRSIGGAGESLLQRISGVRIPSPPSSNARGSQVEIPAGVVPRSVTRTWHTFLLHSVLNKLPTDQIRDMIIKPELPVPVAIQVKRNPAGKRFCLVFVAYRSAEERDLAGARLEGFEYGVQKLRLLVKTVDKPAVAYDWKWDTTTDEFRADYLEQTTREPAAKRRRISSAGSHRRSPSPPRLSSIPPPPVRSRPPSPVPRLHPRLSSEVDSRSRSPARALSRSRGHSRSPDRRHHSPPRAVVSRNQPVPKALINKLYSVILHNLPNDVKRADVIAFFPPNTFVGVAVNPPGNRRYITEAARRPVAHASAFLVFETDAGRQSFVKRFCTRKYFKKTPVPMWYDTKTARVEEWLWSEMLEDWVQRNGGPPAAATLPPVSRIRSPSPPRTQPRDSVPASDRDRFARTRENSTTPHLPTPSGPRNYTFESRPSSRGSSPSRYAQTGRYGSDIPPASSRLLVHPSTAALLDVLAPAAFSTLSISSAPPSSTAPRPAALFSPSTSKVRLDDDPAPTTRKQRRQARIASGEPPARVHRGRPPSSSRTPSAVDLLSKIRNTHDAATDPAVERHNEAMLSIVRGTRDPRRDFTDAFKRGWVPIRDAGQVARVPAKDLAKVLRTCTLAERDADRDVLGYDWTEVRELVLWLAGEKDMAGLVEWAWSAIETGPVGCRRVVEVWDAVARGEHWALREGPSAINHAFQPKREFSATTPNRPKPPAFLYAAYIAATSVCQRHAASELPSFKARLPAFLDPAVPAVHRWLNHSDAETWLNRAFTTPAYASDPDAFPAAVAWLRQVALAQIWYEQRSLPGLGLVRHVRGAFQRSAHKQVWELWWTLKEAVDNEEFGWISVAEWDSSARQRWVNREGMAALETDELRERRPESHSNLAPPTSLDSEAPPTPPASSAPTSLPAALLTQAIVNPFLSGFVRAQLLQQANQIWAWLVGHSPSLVPGIVTWNGLLTGYAQRGDTTAVENAWADMAKNRVEPNLWSWLARIDAYFSSKRCDEALEVSRQMMADKDVLKEVAQEHAGRFPEVVWDKLIHGLLSNGRRDAAEQILGEMDKAGSPPTIHSVNLFLKYYTRGKKPDLPSVVRMLKLISDRDLEADVFTYTMVLVALLAGGQKDATAKTIEIMESTRVKPTVTTYGAIIHSLAHSGQPEHLTAAVQLLDEMEGRKLATNEIIYTSLIQGFLRAIPATPLRSHVAAENEDGQHPYFRAALTLKARMERRGIQLNRVGYNAFLGAALALQSDWGVELALKTYKEMKRRPGLLGASAGERDDEDPRDDGYSDLHKDGRHVTASDTYYVLLEGFVRMKDWNRARGIVREMERTGFEVRNRGLRKLIERVGGGGGSNGLY
ncbi:hypothetical protein JCM11491_004527 [Sporobolomyces phaffii]